MKGKAGEEGGRDKEEGGSMRGMSMTMTTEHRIEGGWTKEQCER